MTFYNLHALDKNNNEVDMGFINLAQINRCWLEPLTGHYYTDHKIFRTLRITQQTFTEITTGA